MVLAMFKTYQHILPRGRAWNTAINKPLTRFIKGLGESAKKVKAEFDNIYDDLRPESTRELDSWELQFGLPKTGLNEKQRRDRLFASWQALGGQSASYIQETLQGAGFYVFVHEWWVPGTEPAVGVHGSATAKNPNEVIFSGVGQPTGFRMQDGGEIAQDGALLAMDGLTSEALGYLLVNKVKENSGGQFVEKKYTIPTDQDKWRYFMYISGEDYPTIANVSKERKEEFETLCLKLCPAHLWIGMLVEYS